MMPRTLTHLSIKDCPNLRSLPENLYNLNSLTKLKISSCRDLTSLPMMPRRLTHLSVKDCPNLQDLGDNLYSGKLEIENCPRLEAGLDLTELQLKVEDSALPFRLKSWPSSSKYNVGKETGRQVGKFKDMNDRRGYLDDVEIREDAPTAGLNLQEEVEVTESLEPHLITGASSSSQNYSREWFPNWMDFVQFSSLKCLEMKWLSGISRVVDIQLLSLEVLQIGGCPMLRDVSMVVPKLSKFSVEDCQELTKLSLLPSLNDNDSNSNYSSWIDLSQLEELEMCKCPNLRDTSMAIPNLKKLRVKDCTELNLTFTMQLPCLQELELALLPYLTSLHDLRIFYTERLGSKDANGLRRGLLPQLLVLHSLKIEKCEQLRTLTMDEPPPHTLQDPETINCRQSESAFADTGNLSCLRKLDLASTSLSGLSDSICRLHNLESLDLRCCLRLNILPSAIGDIQSLRELHLEWTFIHSLPHSFCKLYNLQILNLKGCRCLSSLPGDLGDLRNLRELVLSLTLISTLPESVCKLSNLEVLDLTCCKNFTHLPKTIGDLRNLKKLNLHFTKILSLPESIVNITGLKTLGCCIGGCHGDPVKLPLYFGKLINLESLEEYVVAKEIGQGIEELKDMNNLKGAFVISNMENIDSMEKALMANLKEKIHIEELTFNWSPLLPKYNDSGDVCLEERNGEMDAKVLESLEPYQRIITFLSFRNYSGEMFPKWMSVMTFSSLKHLVINGLYNITIVANIELPSLEFLVIYKCPRLTDVFMAPPKLTKLKVEDCQELTKLSLLPSLQGSNSSFSLQIELTELKQLEICKCPRLKDVSMAVPEMRKLQVKDCIELNIIFTMQILCLRELELELLPYLSSIHDLRISYAQGLWSGDIDQSKMGVLSQLTTLEMLRIEKCNQLRSLAMDKPLPPTLRIINIINCEKLESLFEDGVLPTLESLTIRGCSELKSIPHRVCNLASLRELEIEDSPLLELLPNHKVGFPPVLASLRIISCPNLTSLPKAMHNLTTLTYLLAYYCPRLVSFPEEGLPPMLRELWIGFCPNILYLPKDLYNLKYLQKLGIKNCPQLEVKTDDQLPPTLKWLIISDCPKLQQQVREEVRKDWLDLMEQSIVEMQPNDKRNDTDAAKQTDYRTSSSSRYSNGY